jgi:hypothetical protein
LYLARAAGPLTSACQSAKELRKVALRAGDRLTLDFTAPPPAK